MAFIQFHFFSEALQMQTEAYVIMPQKQAHGQIGLGTKADGEKYKCLYLLHGLSDDHTAWMRYTAIERYAEKYGICVVMPCVHRSFYLDLPGGRNYYTFVSRELPRVMSEFFNISDKKEDNFVAGLSMGGYGALKMAMRERGRFSAAVALSSAIEMFTPERVEFGKQLLGSLETVSEEDDLACLATELTESKDKPKIFMAVGKDDFLYPENIRFRDHLNSLGFDLTFIEDEGDHTWEFWDKYIQIAFEWLFGEK